MEGQVKWFDEKKGYGFIATENQGDVFVHARVSRRPMVAGEIVNLNVAEGPRGLYATAMFPSPRSHYSIVFSGSAYSNTGERIYVPRNSRRATWSVTHGYKTSRGDTAIVVAGTYGLRAQWSRREILIEAVQFLGPPEFEGPPWVWGAIEPVDAPWWELLMEHSEITPQELTAAEGWLRNGQAHGRQTSHWPVIHCRKCRPYISYEWQDLGPAGVPCQECGAVGDAVIWRDPNS